jgi:hypothetical protein
MWQPFPNLAPPVIFFSPQALARNIATCVRPSRTLPPDIKLRY